MAARTYDVSVVGSAFNEGNNIIELVERLQKVFAKKNIDGEIVLINDKSTDDTGRIMDDLAKRYTNVRIVHNEKNLGIAVSWKKGIHTADGTYVCLMDTDLQNLPEDIYKLYREITFTNADLVQGWRSHVGRTRRSAQFFLSRGLNIVLNVLFGMHLHDNKSGFVIARKEVLEDVMKHRGTYKHFQTFITVAAHAKGYVVRDIETLFAERTLGKSYIAGKLLKTTWETSVDICKGLLEFRFFDWYDTSLREYTRSKQLKKHEPHVISWWYRLYHVLFPLHHWMISYNASRYYEDLSETQWLSLEDMRGYQNAKLRQLVAHAYYHVPFYRETMDARGLKPTDIRSTNDLQKLPIINKSVVRENLHLGMLSNNHDKRHLLTVTTSGSTGEPFTIYAEKKQLEMRWAATLRSTEWTGYRFGDRQVRLWHKHLGMKPIEVLKERLDAFFTRRKFIPAYEISEENIGTFLDEIMSFKPVLLDGYAESYNIIAQKLGQGAYEGHRPKGIMSSGQTLPRLSRERIEKAFGCKVYDKYGAREFAGGLAYQCEKQHDNYHVVAECAVIEVVDADGKPVKPGEMGAIVVTELNNYASPLIRYKLGDFGIAVDENIQCECGRGLPLIGPIQGRIQATILGANNQLIPGTFFARLFADYDYAIRQFQVVQSELGKITLKIVKANRYTDNVLEKVMAEIKKHLSDTIQVSIEFVDVIPLGRTGKRHHSMSTLDLDTILFKEKQKTHV
jgi:phenylacetate-CoA ligase